MTFRFFFWWFMKLKLSGRCLATMWCWWYFPTKWGAQFKTPRILKNCFDDWLNHIDSACHPKKLADVEWHCLQNLSSDRNMIPWPRCIRKRRSSLVCNGTFLSIDKSNQKRKAKQLDRRSRYILEWLFYNYCILLFRYGLTSVSLKLPASRIQCFCGNQFETDPKKSVLQRN